MFSNDLNLNHLRIFESVARTLSMTDSARELHLTQSGISQHIQAFEHTLGIKLFDRVKKRLVPTQAAIHLRNSVQQSFKLLVNDLDQIQAWKKEYAGSVEIGMPIEFGNHVMMPIISDLSKKFPKVNFVLRYGFATEMNDALIHGQMDFAFIDSFSVDRRIFVKPIYQETLSLCMSAQALPRAYKESHDSLMKLPFVDYQIGHPLLNLWFKHHYKRVPSRMNIRAVLMDVQGVSRLILNGAGAGVLPDYQIDNLIRQGAKLMRFKGSGKPLQNQISLSQLQGKTMTIAAKAILDEIRNRLKS